MLSTLYESNYCTREEKGVDEYGGIEWWSGVCGFGLVEIGCKY